MTRDKRSYYRPRRCRQAHARQHARGACSGAATQEKLLPPDFISADGFGITEAARRYLAPLIIGECYPPFKYGLPDYVTLQNVAVPKKLATEFTV